LESIYIEEPCPRGPFGAKSVAEMSVIAPVPAIINAIADATGHRVKDIPATPARVLAALTGDG
jgi:aldehyde oxidoreductase